MKLLYLSNERIPSRYASSMQQMKMCNAFVKNNLDVQLIRPYFPDVANFTTEEIFSYYDVAGGFRLTTLPTLLSLSKPQIDQINGQKKMIPFIGGASVLLIIQFFIWQQLICRAFDVPTVIYARSINMAYMFLKYRHSWLLKNKPVRVFIEAHGFDQQPASYFQRLVQFSDGVIVNSRNIASELAIRFNCSMDKILVAPNGSDIDQAEKMPLQQSSAREKIAIQNKDTKIVGYTGSLLPGKGVEVLVESARYLPPNIIIMIVGGSDDQVRQLKEYCLRNGLNNVLFKGFVTPSDVIVYQKASDVLVLPNTDESSDSRFTSPLKLFNYMAARRPVIATNLPVFTELLQNGENALLVPMKSPQALARGIQAVLDNPNLAEKISENAYRCALQNTWENRAKKVIEFIEKKYT